MAGRHGTSSYQFGDVARVALKNIGDMAQRVAASGGQRAGGAAGDGASSGVDLAGYLGKKSEVLGERY